MQTLGGVQRVVSTVCNRLIEEGKDEIIIIAPRSKSKTILYPLDSRIIELPQEDYIDKPSFIFKLIRKLNKKYAFFKYKMFVGLLDHVYLSKQSADKLKQFIINEKIDVVIGTAPFYAMAAAKAAQGTNVKVVGWMHSTYESYFEMQNHVAYGMKELFSKYCKKMDLFWVLTKKDQEIFNHHLNVKPVVLYDPITINIDHYSEKQLNKLLFVGRLSYEHKGIDMLVPIMKHIIKELPDCHLDVIGDGPDKEKFANLIKAENMEKCITLHGSSNNVKAFYEKAALLFVTSRYEGFGLVLTEAMAHGVPVVAFHNYGPDEIIENEISGYLIDQFDIKSFAEKSCSVLKDPVKMAKLSEAAILRADLFSLDNICSQFISDVSELLNQ